MKQYFMTTDRLGFGVWTENDMDSAAMLWRDEDVTRYARDGGPFTDEEIRDLLKREAENQNTYGVQYWPIYVKETGELAGCCGMKPSERKNTMELRFYLFRKYWGQGLGSEAARRVISYAFDMLKVKTLIARHHPDNSAAAKCLSGLGFSRTEDQTDPSSGIVSPTYKLIKGYQG